MKDRAEYSFILRHHFQKVGVEKQRAYSLNDDADYKDGPEEATRRGTAGFAERTTQQLRISDAQAAAKDIKQECGECHYANSAELDRDQDGDLSCPAESGSSVDNGQPCHASSGGRGEQRIDKIDTPVLR